MRRNTFPTLTAAALAALLAPVLFGCGGDVPEANPGAAAPPSTVSSTLSGETTTSSPASSTSHEPAATAAVVTLEDVRYGCGPTDATGIAFTAASDAPMSGRAELVVGDGVFGSTGEITIGPVPRQVWMDIGLDQEAYDAGAGELHFRAMNSNLDLAVEPVILRLQGDGGCG